MSEKKKYAVLETVNEVTESVANYCEEALQSVVTARKPLRELSDVFFEPVRGNPDDPFQSPLCTMTRILRQQGLHEDQLKAALLMVSVMVSAPLGYPTALILVDKTSNATALLSKAVQLIPREAIFECMELSRDSLYLAANDLCGKVILSPDSTGLKRVKSDLEQLVEHGHAQRQEKVSSKFWVGIEALEIKGPVSIIAIARESRDFEWSGSCAFRLQSTTHGAETYPTMLPANDEFLYIETLRIAKYLGRLAKCRVEIPFTGNLLTQLKDLKVVVPENVLKPFLNLLSIITILNNPAPVFEDEIIAEIYGAERSKLRNWLARKGYDADVLPVEQERPKIATKVDYYLASLLLDGCLDVGNDALTDGQARIFEAIKGWNIGCIGETFIDQGNNVQKLSTIANNSNAWADRVKIFELVNNDGQEFLSLSTVNNEIMALMEKDLIGRQKAPKGTKYGYFILNVEAGKAIRLPNPSTITDPVYEGRTVKVLNPLTGEVAEI